MSSAAAVVNSFVFEAGIKSLSALWRKIVSLVSIDFITMPQLVPLNSGWLIIWLMSSSIPGLAGLVLGGYTFRRFRSDGSVGKWMPIAGISISIIAIVLGLVFTVVFIRDFPVGPGDLFGQPKPIEEWKVIQFQCPSCDASICTPISDFALGGVEYGIIHIECPNCRKTVKIPPECAKENRQ